MKIILDSNPIFQDYLLDSALFVTLKRYVSLTQEEIIIPEVVIEEVIRQYGTKYSEGARSYEDFLRLSSVIGVELTQPIPTSESIDAYRMKLQERITEMGVRVLPVPDVEAKEVLKRDIAAKKPFDSKGKGFRDTLIWLSILEECKSHDEKIVLISADKGFMADSRSGNEKSLLHADLRDDLHSLGIDEERVEIRKTIYDFNQEFAIPIVERFYQSGDPIEGTFAESLQPSRMLERYGEAAARELHTDLHSILPLGSGYPDELRFVDWLGEVELLQALDLGEGVVQSFIRTRVIFDTDIYGSEEVLNRLTEFIKNRTIILQNFSWDENQRNMYIHLRVSILSDVVINWDTQEDQGTAFAILRYGFTKEELEESRLFLY